jgi:hypothetical protein
MRHAYDRWLQACGSSCAVKWAAVYNWHWGYTQVGNVPGTYGAGTKSRDKTITHRPCNSRKAESWKRTSTQRNAVFPNKNWMGRKWFGASFHLQCSSNSPGKPQCHECMCQCSCFSSYTTVCFGTLGLPLKVQFPEETVKAGGPRIFF